MQVLPSWLRCYFWVVFSEFCLSFLGDTASSPWIGRIATAQAVVRATSTTTSLVSIKFLTYLFMGAGSWDDLPLYIVAITCSVTGLQARRLVCVWPLLPPQRALCTVLVLRSAN